MSHRHKQAQTHSCADDAPAPMDPYEHLIVHLKEIICPSMVIVCVGNDLCGDDGAGPTLARTLPKTIPWTVFDTGTVPESFLMKIAQAKPESLLLIDALDFGAAPGEVEFFMSDDITGQGPSTHGPAPLAFLEVLQMIHPCRNAVLGIQPKDNTIGSSLSKPVAQAVDMIARAIQAMAAEADHG